MVHRRASSNLEEEAMIYLAHEIRGSEPHSPAKQAANMSRALLAASLLREKYPDKAFYVPAEHDDFPQQCLRMGLLTVDDVLSVDLSILNRCEGLWVLLPGTGFFALGSGVRGEIEFAAKNRIPTWFIALEELQ
jgi:hypothetical protein